MTDLIEDTKTLSILSADVGRGAEQLRVPVGERAVNRSDSCVEVDSPVTPFVLRLDRVPSTPAALSRIHARVDEINRRLQEAEMPFRLRVMHKGA